MEQQMQITVAGTTYDCPVQEVPTKGLKKDPDNGRLQHLPGPLSQDEIHDVLKERDDTKKLVDSIIHGEGLMETPFGILLPDDDEFEVLLREGNTRKVCYDIILDRIETGKMNLNPKKFEKMKVWIYPSHMPVAHQLLHVASMHYAGKKDWKKLNQAAFITTLREDPDVTDEDIVKCLQVSKGTLSKQKKAFDQTKKYHIKYPEDTRWIEKYSHFERLFAQRVLNDYKGKIGWCSDPKNLDLYMKWVAAGRIPYPHIIPRIHTILTNDTLEKRFVEAKEGSVSWMLEDALADAAKRKSLNDSIKEISKTCDQAVNDLIDYLPDLGERKEEAMANNDKLVAKYEDCIERLRKFVDKVKAAKGN